VDYSDTGRLFSKEVLVRSSPDQSNAIRSMELARSNISGASKNVEIEEYRTAVILSYTAMFHAARAILFIDGIKVRSHECIPVYLRETHPSLEKQAIVLDSYRLYRHNAIYGLDFEAGKQDAVSSINTARDFLSAIEKELVIK
jgi:uncharacterized protein (UPF0332 family)